MMTAPHPPGLGRKAAWFVAALLIVLGAAGSIGGTAPAAELMPSAWQQIVPKTGPKSWHSKYARPHAIPFPKDDPYSAAKLALGRMLFFDPILSGAKVRSCSTCHDPGLSWADGRPRAIGEKQEVLPLRTPTLLNVAWTPRLGWDGHFRDLESVAMGPITAANNMDLAEDKIVGRLDAIPGYVEAFHAAFGGGAVTKQNVELALATFERSIVSGQAPFDRWINGNETAISAAAKRGFGLFNGKAHCATCHSGWAFTDTSFHDIGTARGADIGRGQLFPNSVALRYAFKTPTLRDVARRGPYMHDGSVPTLEAVIDLYDRGGIARPSRDPNIEPLGLSAGEKADLVAFLDTLTEKGKAVAIPNLPR
jgi:cytochrome c peroxidase